MKKSLFLLASLGVFSLSQAQTMFVKKGTKVKVNHGALLFVDGNMNVDDYGKQKIRGNDGNYSYSDLEQKVSNEGNVEITGVLNVGDTKYGLDFVNELTSKGYGQLIVHGGEDHTSANTGDITSEILFKTYGSDKKTVFGYYPLSVPFDNKMPTIISGIYGYVNLGSMVRNFSKLFKDYNTAPKYNKFDKNRYKNGFFTWDNQSGTQVLDQMELRPVFSSTKNLYKPATYWAVNFGFTDVKGEVLPDGKKEIPGKFLTSVLQGVPNNLPQTVEVKKYTISNNKDRNKYGEQFGSYVIDFTKDRPNGFEYYGPNDKLVKAGDFGSNIFMFGNPFTSNINLLAKDNGVPSDFSKVAAIVQFDQSVQRYNSNVNEYDGVNSGENPNTTYSNSYGTPMKAVTGDGTGNSAAVYVAPYQTFAVKLNDQSPTTFHFTDGMKTFHIPEHATNVVLSMAERANRPNVSINQLGLDLYDNSGFTGVQTYVVASDIYEADRKGKGIELTNTSVGNDDTSLYTLQENEDGSAIDDKAYINGVNADKYVGKPIHLVLQNGKGQYTIKGDLNEDLSNNKNAFYFEDKKEGKVLKVGKDFSYTFNAEGTDKDRFVLYWAKTPKAELSKDLAKEVKSSSVVYKDAAGTYRVRFDRAIKKADVFVYNISGQLVNVAKAVDTANDYIVPVKGNSSVYVVKIVGDNGSVTTKKIIK